MKRKVLGLIGIVMFLTSCVSINNVQGTLNRDYGKNVTSYSSSLTFEELWSKVIDFFSEKGIGIQTIDKSSGLIVSQDYSFNGKITIEQRVGPNYELMNKSAWAVCNCDYTVLSGDPMSKKGLEKSDTLVFYPTSPTNIGNFNVRLKSENGKTKISINLSSFRFSFNNMEKSALFASKGLIYSAGYQTTVVPYQAYSTGVFEKLVIDYIDKDALKL